MTVMSNVFMPSYLMPNDRMPNDTDPLKSSQFLVFMAVIKYKTAFELNKTVRQNRHFLTAIGHFVAA